MFRFKKLVILVSIIITILLLTTNTVLAEDRFVVGTKMGAGYGILGLEIEKEFSNQFSILGGFGYAESYLALSLTVAFRYYLAKTESRLFVSPFVSYVISTVEELAMPLYGITVGYEWRINRELRFTVEGGVGFVTIIPFPAFGLSLGYIF